MPGEHKHFLVAFYARLLRLYPQPFKDRFSESMEQTFNDLWSERNERSAAAGIGFMSRMTSDAIGGIIREHLAHSTAGDTMKNLRFTVIGAAVVSFFVVLPLMVMEVVNRRNLPEGFPVVLFITMWLLATIFGVIAVSVGSSLIAENGLRRHPVRLLLGAVFALSIAIFWSGLLVDQMPCFLGVPNCD